MDQDTARWRHRLRTHLTTVKLALQLLKRRPELCQQDDGPRERALEATDALVEDVAQLERAMETIGSPESIATGSPGSPRGR
jgi:hypothetical protein